MTAPKHAFLFHPGQWLGEGDVTFLSSPDKVHFYTKWEIEQSGDGVIHCKQTVELADIEEHVVNCYSLSSITESRFEIHLENETLKSISGKGFADPLKLAWEFRGHSTFEGFEVYELQQNGEYKMHGEYTSTDQFRTIIDGRIWLKAAHDPSRSSAANSLPEA